MNDAMLLNIVAGPLFAYAQQWLKGSSTPWLAWINAHSAAVNRIVAALVACATTLGIHLTFAGSMQSGGALNIAWPPLATMVALGEHATVQWLAGTAYYHVAIKK